MCICKGSLCLVCRRRLTSAKDIQVVIFMFQKFVKLSSVTPAELCYDTLRSMLKFLPTCIETLEGKYYCLTCHPYRSLSNRMYPIRKQLQMSITICIHLVMGEHCYINTTVSPPIGGCQNGAAGYASNNSLTRGYSTVQNRSQDGRSTMVALCMQQPF